MLMSISFQYSPLRFNACRWEKDLWVLSIFVPGCWYPGSVERICTKYHLAFDFFLFLPHLQVASVVIIVALHCQSTKCHGNEPKSNIAYDADRPSIELLCYEFPPDKHKRQSAIRVRDKGACPCPSLMAETRYLLVIKTDHQNLDNHGEWGVHIKEDCFIIR